MSSLGGRKRTLAYTILFTSLVYIFCFATSTRAQGFGSVSTYPTSPPVYTGTHPTSSPVYIQQGYGFGASSTQTQRRSNQLSPMIIAKRSFVNGEWTKFGGGLVSDFVLGQIYSPRRGYGPSWLPPALRARRAW